jgi:hypothetical protein
MRDIDNFYLFKDEPVKSCLHFLRMHILNYNENITEAWKCRMPFFCYKGKMFCYLWIHKKTQQPFIGFVDGKLIQHPSLMFEDRARIKIMLLNAEQDLPVETIDDVLKLAVDTRNASL